MRRIGQRIARLGLLHRHEGADVARANLVDFLGRVGLHFHDTADALLLAAGDVEQRVALLDDARIDAAEGQRAELVVDHLERECARRRVVDHVLVADDVAVFVHHGNAAVLARIRQVVDHAVQQLLHALVLERRAAEHRHQLAGHAALANAVLERVLVELRQFRSASRRPSSSMRQCGFEHFLAQLRQVGRPTRCRRPRVNVQRAQRSPRAARYPTGCPCRRPSRCSPRRRPGRPCRTNSS